MIGHEAHGDLALDWTGLDWTLSTGVNDGNGGEEETSSRKKGGAEGFVLEYDAATLQLSMICTHAHAAFGQKSPNWANFGNISSSRLLTDATGTSHQSTTLTRVTALMLD